MASEEKFSVEWQIYNKILPEYEVQFLKWIGPLKPDDFKGKMILDAGCGNGRNSFWPIKYGASKVVAFDHAKQTVEVAKTNLKKFKNAQVFFGSIYDIPYRNKFDIAFSIGVIHHLMDPEKAIRELTKATKPGGLVLIWVYGLEGNKLIVLVVNAIRSMTKFFPPRIVRLIALPLTAAVYLMAKINISRRPYVRQLAHFKFNHIHSIVFDQLLPTVADYYTKSRARELLVGNRDLEEVRIYRVNQNSWTVLAKKKLA